MHFLRTAVIALIVNVLFLKSVEKQLLGQNRTITISDRRPLVRALDQMEALSGVPINYEDVPYESSADVEDISTSQQRAASPGYHLVVPRMGNISVATQAELSLANTLSSLANLLASYRANALPGDFVFGESNGTFSVTPLKGLDGSGKQKDVRSPLVAPVTIPEETRTVGDTVAVVLASISKASGVNVILGTFPFPFSAKVTLGSTAEPGRQVLTALFGKLTSKPVSYRLLFDPTFKEYMLNLQVITKKDRSFAAPMPVSGALGDWFLKK
ncbi:MAG: hypothetical protein M3Z09_15475 [Acidobacteriota bacterium]|nr:hypothetical protein [Acidobacteriota bacterium]